MPVEPASSAFADRRPSIMRLVFFVIGALSMLSFAPFGFWLLAPILLLPVLYTCLRSAPRVAAGHCFWFGSGLFLAGTYWLYISIHVFGQAPLWIALLLMVALVVIMGLYYAACGWLISRLSGGSAIRLLVVAPATWVAVEWFRGWFLSGFPWMSLGYAQIDSPLSGAAPVIGVFGVSALLVFSTSALLAGYFSRRRIVWGLIAVAPWLAGYALQQVDWTRPAGEPLRVAIVQGGISQDRKWLPDQFQSTLDTYFRATFESGEHDLVVWPEVAIPASVDQVPAFLNAVDRELRARGQTLALGILERDLAEQRVYNSVMMLNGRDRQTYRKRHLVPFGEVFPVPDFVREWMRLMSLPHSDMTPGEPEQALLVTAGGTRISVAICYEDAYGAEQLYALPEAGIMVNVSNDAWFGDSIAPHQHLEIARMRALEAGRYVVRATNNGISAFIGPNGELLERGPQFEFARMSRDIVAHAGLTPYARWGNWPVIGPACALLAFFGWSRGRSSNS